MLKWIARALGAVVIIVVGAFLVAAWIYRDIPAEEIERKYRHPHSQYADIDGVRIHYVDEGSGPPIVLIHAHYWSLRMWEPWARELAATHRVVRFDLPSHGLTRPDPTGDYTLERGIELIEKLTAELGIERFVIGGASLGGTHAIRYAAKHPEQIERLVLVNPGALEGAAANERMATPGARFMLWLVQYITPRKLAEVIVSSGFADKSQVPPELIDECYDLWMMEDQREAEIARVLQYRSTGTEAAIAAVEAPVLLMWGEDNPIAHFEQAAELEHMLTNAASVELISYPGVGHLATYEAPDATARDVREWLARPPGPPVPEVAAGPATADAT